MHARPKASARCCAPCRPFAVSRSALRPISRRQHLRRRALLYRRGGGRGRRMRGAGSGRPDHLDASRPRPLHRQGRRPGSHDGRTLRPRDRLLQRQGRLDAYRRFRQGHARRQRHRGRRHRDRDRRGARGAAGRNGRVAVCFFGDGAANAGPFTSRSISRRPGSSRCVYVCENNLYAAQTGQMATHAMPDVAGRAAGYGIPGVVVDGNDIFAVHEAAGKAVARARAGEGPTLIECKTTAPPSHRTEGSAGSRPRRRSCSGFGRARPDRAARRASQGQQGQLTDEEWKEMDREISRAIEKAVAFARASPFPRPEAATEDVFAAP